MSHQIQYKIANLECSYNNTDIVLSIPELEIEKGKLHFFIGSSGIGKSTLLETLGMMNKPVKNNSNTSLKYYKDDEEIDILSLWKLTDEKISGFRLQNFSFIFQNTNLMPHFSAGENMFYTLLIEGENLENASKRVHELMELLSLENELYNRPVHQLSGGQRQRIAFVRAFVSSFEVLFGDEPTGNLDPKKADDLMSILKNYIIRNHKTAIIVSHDITLAEKYADCIHCIKKEQGKDYGTLNPESRYFCIDKNWFDYNRNSISNLSSELLRYL